MILMVPSFNLSMVESENIVGARPSAVLPTDDPLKQADLSSVINLNPDKGKALFVKAPRAAETRHSLWTRTQRTERRQTTHRSRSGLAWRGVVWARLGCCRSENIISASISAEQHNTAATFHTKNVIASVYLSRHLCEIISIWIIQLWLKTSFMVHSDLYLESPKSN